MNDKELIDEAKKYIAWAREIVLPKLENFKTSNVHNRNMYFEIIKNWSNKLEKLIIEEKIGTSFFCCRRKAYL